MITYIETQREYTGKIVSAPDPRERRDFRPISWFSRLSGYAIKPDCHVIWFAIKPDCHVLLHVLMSIVLGGFELGCRCHMIFVRRRRAGVLIGLPEVNICRVSTTKKSVESPQTLFRVREGLGPRLRGRFMNARDVRTGV